MTRATLKPAARNLHLCLFPLGEIASFAACLFWAGRDWRLCVMALLLSALCLNFAVHITFHELVHTSGNRNSITLYLWSGLSTLLAGIPFDGYRWHHYTHHRYNNRPEDYSSTWKITPQGWQARRCLEYAAKWPDQLVRGRAGLKTQLLAGAAPFWIHRRIQWQKILLLTFYLALAFVSWKGFGLYLLLIYLGWFLVSWHNYGQHLPVEKPGAYATSYPNRWYNFLFCNNGIHYEHHAAPQVPWHQLSADPMAPWTVGLPHLAGPWFSLSSASNLSPIVFRKREKE